MYRLINKIQQQKEKSFCRMRIRNKYNIELTTSAHIQQIIFHSMKCKCGSEKKTFYTDKSKKENSLQENFIHLSSKKNFRRCSTF